MDGLQILGLVGIGSILGSLITTLVQFEFEKAKEKRLIIRNTLAAIRRILYLLRITYYMHAEASVDVEYYKALHRITGDTFFHQQAKDGIELMRLYSGKIYDLYGSLNEEYAKIGSYVSSKKKSELLKFFDIDNYQTIEVGDASHLTEQETTEKYRIESITKIKTITDEDMKEAHLKYYKILLEHFK